METVKLRVNTADGSRNAYTSVNPDDVNSIEILVNNQVVRTFTDDKLLKDALGLLRDKKKKS